MKYPCQDYMMNNVQTVQSQCFFGDMNKVGCRLCGCWTWVETYCDDPTPEKTIEIKAIQRICKENCKYYAREIL